MLKNLPIIPSRTSQNLSLLFFKIPPIIPKLFRSNSKYIMNPDIRREAGACNHSNHVTCLFKTPARD